jgi:hypothetical protein
MIASTGDDLDDARKNNGEGIVSELLPLFTRGSFILTPLGLGF